jgi:hypothetical protein
MLKNDGTPVAEPKHPIAIYDNMSFHYVRYLWRIESTTNGKTYANRYLECRKSANNGRA